MTPPATTSVSEAAPSGSLLKRGHVGFNLAMLFGGQATTWILTLLFALIVPRQIGPRGVGLLVIAFSAQDLLSTLVGLGTETFLIREIAADRSQAGVLTGTALMLRALSSLPCLAIVALYVKAAGFHGDEATVLYVAGLATAIFLFAEPIRAAFQGVERMEYMIYVEVLNKGVRTVVSIVMVFLGFGALALVVLQLSTRALGLALSLWWARPLFRIELRSSLNRLLWLLRHSLSFWAFDMFFTIYLWIDSIMLSLMTPATVVGWYGVPTRLYGSMIFAPVLLATAWLPRLVAAFTESPRRLDQVARDPLRLMLAVSLPISAGVALVAKPLILTIYGPAYAPSVPVLIILALTAPLMCLGIMASNFLVAQKRQAVWTKVMALASIVNPTLNFFLIRYTQQRLANGAVGAAVSLLLTELLLGLVAIAVVRQIFDRDAIARVLRCGVATVAMAVVAYSAGRLVAGFGSLAILLTDAMVGMAIFTMLAMLLRVPTPSELIQLTALLARLKSRGLQIRAPI